MLGNNAGVVLKIRRHQVKLPAILLTARLMAYADVIDADGDMDVLRQPASHHLAATIKKEELDDIIDVDGDLDVLRRPVPQSAAKLVKEEVKEEPTTPSEELLAPPPSGYIPSSSSSVNVQLSEELRRDPRNTSLVKGICCSGYPT